MAKKPDVTIYTDGSAENHIKGGGQGGWGAVLLSGSGDRLRVIGGPLEQVTNNMAETIAVTKAIKQLNYPCNILLVVDSQYVVFGLKRIMRDSLLKTNVECWEELRTVLREKNHKLNLDKTKAHDVDEINNLADSVAYYCSVSRKSYDAYFDSIHSAVSSKPKA